MSVESIGSIESNATLPSRAATGQSAFPRQNSSEELPKIEFKTASELGSDVLQDAVDAANHIFSYVRPDIKFVIDESTKDVVIMLIEPETGAVINRYPTEQALAISNAIIESQARLAEQHEAFNSSNDGLLGLFVQQKI